MGMFDYYQPVPELKCSVCDGVLTGWQGKDGPCALFVWQQGFAAPTDQNVRDKCRSSDSQIANARLPVEFYISSDDCGCSRFVEAIGRTINGIWMTTELVTVGNTNQGPHETRDEYKARLAWLRGLNR